MSCIADTIVAFSVCDEDRVHDITEYFESIDQVPPVFLDDDTNPRKYGGTYAIQRTVMVGAYNYLDIDALVQFMESLTWINPEDVQLLIANEHDEPHVFSERLNRKNMKERS